jgi:HK97 family phage major capsid protein
MLDPVARAAIDRARDALDIADPPGRIGLSLREKRDFSLFRALRALKEGRIERSPEFDFSEEIAKRLGVYPSSRFFVPMEILERPLGPAAARAMSTLSGSKGGYLVGVENMSYIDVLRARSVATRLGAQMLSGLRGNVAFGRGTGTVTTVWQGGDGTSASATDQALGQSSMTPRTCIAITDVSEQLLAQSAAAEAFLMADLATGTAKAVDRAVISGAGGAEPLGIKNTPGVTTGQDAANATYAKVLAFPGTAGTANAIGLAPAFIANTAGTLVLAQRQRFSGVDSPLWTGNVLDGELAGFRAMSSEQVSSANLIFGSWDEIVIGEWGVLELAVDRGGTRFNAGQVGIRAMWMVDVLLRHPQAFIVSTNLS